MICTVDRDLSCPTWVDHNVKIQDLQLYICLHVDRDLPCTTTCSRSGPERQIQDLLVTAYLDRDLADVRQLLFVTCLVPCFVLFLMRGVGPVWSGNAIAGRGGSNNCTRLLLLFSH